MKTTHIRITKHAKKLLKEMAKEETSAEKLEEIIQETYDRKVINRVGVDKG